MEFLNNHTLAHYTKTSYWATLQKGVHHLVGLENNGELVATALILEKKWLGKSYFYIPAGPCLDFHKTDITSTFFDHLISFAIERNVFMIRTDPNLLRVSRDTEGNQIDGESNEFVTNFLISKGFIHKGYGYAYNGSWMNRFTLILNIQPSFEEIFSGFNKSRQNRLRRHDAMGITTRIGKIEELSTLCAVEKDLAEIQGFKPHSQAFFKKYLEVFKENSRFYITEVNLHTLENTTLDEINSKKYAKDLEALESKKNLLVTIRDLRKKFGNHCAIAAGITLFFGNQAWNLYLYNKKEFTFLNGSDNTHIFSIQDLKKNHVEFYDLCGFSGKTNKEDPHYGLYSYKSSFGTKFVERIGEFDYILSQKKYNHFLSSYRLYNRIRRKLNYLLNKKAK